MSMICLVALAAACGSEGESSEDSVPVVEAKNAVDVDSGDTGAADGSIGEADAAGSDVGDVRGDAPKPGVEILGGQRGSESVAIETVVTAESGLDGPRDLAFNPENRGQLWIVNQNDHSAVMGSNTGTESQSSVKKSGPNSCAFFGEAGGTRFREIRHDGNCPAGKREDPAADPDRFYGVTLWMTDLSKFDAGHSSHLDMCTTAHSPQGLRGNPTTFTGFSMGRTAP